jgi:integrase
MTSRYRTRELKSPVKSSLSRSRAEIERALAPWGATHSANRRFAALRTFWKWAIERQLTTSNPLPGSRPLRHEPARDRVLSDAELSTVWRASERLSPARQGVVRLLILLGQRLREVGGMEWSELSDDVSTWTLPASRSKTRTSNILPLPEPVREILAAQPRTGARWVFTESSSRPVYVSHLGRRLRGLCPELAPWRVHDLRRTARTGWAALGIPSDICELLIHPPVGIRGVYDRHRYLDAKAAALRLWSDHVLGLLRE